MPLTNLLDNKFEFIHQEKIQPSEIGNLPYWEFEAFIERLNKKNDEEREKDRKRNEELKKQNNQNNINPNKYIPKKPKMPKY